MTDTATVLRPATSDDAVAIAALAVQVFLDTYATDGVRPDLAREAFHGYTVDALSQRLAEADRRFLVGERGNAMVGFAEVLLRPLAAPAGDVVGAELVRLYVQPRAHRSGVGRALIGQAEQLASSAALASLWLTAWEGNDRALAFYARMGYSDVGHTTHDFGGNSYGNRVLVKGLSR